MSSPPLDSPFRSLRAYTLRLALLMGVVFSALACEDEPKAPTAVISELGEVVTVGAWLQLSGAESVYPGGEASSLTYEWRLTLRPNGSVASINDTALMEPALFVDLAGQYEVALKVKTNAKWSAEVRATIEAGPCGAQAPVVSEVQQFPTAPGVGSVVELYAAASDPDLDDACGVKVEEGEPLEVGSAPFSVPRAAYDMRYAWRLLSRPVGSSATLEESASVTPRLMPDVEGDYHLEVVVTDELGHTSTPTVHVVSVSACGAGRPEVSAVAISPEPPLVGQALSLTPSVSDADEAEGCAQPQRFRYSWRLNRLPAGSVATLNDASLEVPSFVPDLPGVYALELVVSDQDERSSEPYLVELDLSECGARPPVIDALSVSEGLRVGDTARLSASVSDGDDSAEGCDVEQRLSYQWQLTGLPAGSVASLNRAEAAEPSLMIDVAGDYSVRLVVTDAQGYESEPVDLNFNVGECGSFAPEVSLSARPSAPTVGGVVALHASISDADEGCELSPTSTILWTITSTPAGSAAQLNDPRSLTPSLVADVEGVYEVVAEVTDNTGLMTRSTLSFEALPCGGRAPVVSVVSHEPEQPGVGELVRLVVEASDADHSPECVALRVQGAQELAQPYADEPVGGAEGGAEGGAIAGAEGGAVAGAEGGAVAGAEGGAVAGAEGGSTGGAVAGAEGGSTGGAVAGAEGGAEVELPLQPALYYSWRLLSAPPGGAVSLDDGSLASPSFTPARSGLYSFELVVTDETGLSSEPFVYEMSVSVCGEASPELLVLSADPAPRPHVPAQLSAVVSDADEACGDAASYSYAWRVSAAPVGSEARVSQPTLASPSLTADLPGTYEVTCVVTDPRGLSASASVTLEVSTCGVNAPVVSAIERAEPFANADPFVGATVELLPTAADPDATLPGCELSDRLSYQWRLIEAPTGSLATLNPSERSPSLRPDVAGEYSVSLVVTDAQGSDSEPFLYSFSVIDCGASAPEVSLAYASQAAGRVDPQAPHAGDLISLRMTATDADAACSSPVLSYQWRTLETPAGSEATLNAPQSLTPSFVADLPGRYRFAAIATDETGRQSAEAVVEMSVSDCGSFAPSVDPLLVTQQPATVNAGQRLALNASAATFDADTDPACGRAERFSYAWRLASAPAGSALTLQLSDTASPSFTPDLAGEYELEVVAIDLRGMRSEPSLVTVTVGACGLAAPVVTPSADNTTPNTGALVSLNATSADADAVAPCVDANEYSYMWSFDEVPAGSAATLNAPSARTPSFVADLPGRYVLRVTSTDPRGLSSEPALLSVTAQDCGANEPVINSLNTLTALPQLNAPVHFEALASDSDNELGCALGQQLSYAWSISAAPAGSSATLLSAHTARPSLVPDARGDYVLSVMVSDSTGRSTMGELTLSVGDCGAQAPTLTSLTMNPNPPTLGGLASLRATFSDADNDVGCQAGQSLSLMWRFNALPAGSSASFNNPSLDEPSFSPDVAGDYVIAVRATDSAGVMSPWEELSFTVEECGDATPVVNAINPSDPTPNVDEVVSLRADVVDADTDPACGFIERFSYSWRLISRPEGSSASLEGATLEQSALSPDVAGDYVVGLRVSDRNDRWSEERTLTLSANACGGASPIIDAGSFAVTPDPVVLGQDAQLSASVSDADEGVGCGLTERFSYHWALVSAPAGSQATLNGASLASPSLTPDAPGGYEVTLWVSDASGRVSSTERFTFTAPDCGLSAPVAAIARTAPVGGVFAGDVVQLSGAASADADVACGVNETLSYHWTLLSSPPDSRATLALPNGLTPWFNADVAGDYTVRLVVSDGRQESAPALFTVTAQ